jgi:hypothetical protein
MMRISRVAVGVCSAAMMIAGAGRASGAILGFDNGAGFTVNHTGPTATPPISNGVLTLTNNNVGVALTAFYNTPQDDRNFFASFIYQASGNKSADGAAFVLQNSMNPSIGVGPNALGFGGPGLGYFGITPSVAFELNINSQNTAGVAFGQNGSIGPFTAPGAINLASGDRIGVLLFYTGTVLVANLTDLDNASIPSFSTSTSVNIPSLLGGNFAFVGFTGASGATAAIQTISNFTFVPEPPSMIMAMTGGALGLCSWRLSRRRATGS